MRYTVLLAREGKKSGYWVIVPELPGCFSAGETVDEALKHAREAIELHLQGLLEEGEEIPVEKGPFIVASVAVQRPTEKPASIPPRRR